MPTLKQVALEIQEQIDSLERQNAELKKQIELLKQENEIYFQALSHYSYPCDWQISDEDGERNWFVGETNGWQKAEDAINRVNKLRAGEK